MSTKKCLKCKRNLDTNNFIYNDKDHSTCLSCAEQRRTGRSCDDCHVRASFNFSEEKKAIKCKEHMLPGMVDVKHPKCTVCKKIIPVFNYEGETKVTHCGGCKLPGMVDIKSPKCTVCKKTRPSFSYEGESKATHCGACKLSGMVNVKDLKCTVCKKTQPSFNYEGKSKATHCGACKIPGMVNVKDLKCTVCKKIIPVFNYEGESKATHCGGCKLPGMVDIKSPKCTVCKKTRPSFNYEGESKATHCGACKIPGMVDIKSRKCTVCKKTRPNFNYEGETKATHCGGCKLPGMIDIKNPKCIVCEKIQPVFNYEGEIKATHCEGCKLPEMVDIKNPKCTVCKKQARYGIPHNVRSACVQHKTEGMISNPRAKCLKKNCSDLAEYGIQRPIHCENHKDGNDINLVERKCIKCERIDVVNEEGICVNFCLKSEEYKIYQKQQKTKESRILKILTENIGVPTSYDTIIPTDCGKDDRYRPDFLYDCKTHIAICEADERQHSDRCEQGECYRMRNIFFDNECVPTVFIRYNPDNFKVKGKTVKIPIGKKEEILLKWMKKAMEEIPKNFLSVVYLFYDDYNETVKDFCEIDPYQDAVFACDCGNEYYVSQQFIDHSNSCEIDLNIP